jgi:hypothetical protein
MCAFDELLVLSSENITTGIQALSVLDCGIVPIF